MGTPGNEDPLVPIANPNSMRNSCKQPYIMKCQFTYAIGQNWSGKQLWMHTGTFNKIPFIPLLIHSDARLVSYSTRFEQSWTTNSRFFFRCLHYFQLFSNQFEYQIIQIQISHAFCFFWDPSHCVLGLDELQSPISVSNLETWKDLGSNIPLWNICSILARFWQCGLKLLRYKQNAASAKPLL